ncbi:hypothetical protein EPO17_00715 [Patescibacteria group bacterium]|nr:MAG: hypothetical protein EPO17_00715 [Patescibacteria group bacterium]
MSCSHAGGAVVMPIVMRISIGRDRGENLPCCLPLCFAQRNMIAVSDGIAEFLDPDEFLTTKHGERLEKGRWHLLIIARVSLTAVVLEHLFPGTGKAHAVAEKPPDGFELSESHIHELFDCLNQLPEEPTF